MDNERNHVQPAAAPASLAELRAMAARTGQHVGTVDPVVTLLPDGTLVARCIVFRRPIGRDFPGHFLGTVWVRPDRPTAEARRTAADAAELVALGKAYPEFLPLIAPPVMAGPRAA